MPYGAPHCSIIKRAIMSPAATLVAVAGRITHAEAVRTARRYAAKFARGPRPGYAPATTSQNRPALLPATPRRPSKRKSPWASAPARAMTNSRFALRLLNAVLGENMSSRLFQTVREDHGLAYSIYSAQQFFRRRRRHGHFGRPGPGQSGEDAQAHPARNEAPDGASWCRRRNCAAPAIISSARSI